MPQEAVKMDKSSSLEVIEFYLDEILEDGESYRSSYGMNVAKVLEIIRLPETITEVPGKRHSAAVGTFNLRNRVMPLVDLGLWLEKKTTATDSRKVIVSEFSGVITAFVVSGVASIHRINWSQVEPPGKYLQSFSHGSVTGVVRFDKRIIFLLDMEQIISSMNPSLSLESSAGRVPADPHAGDGRNILVADDSAMIRKTISDMLLASGYSVAQAACGREAWDKLAGWKQLSADEGTPLNKFVDLVISDIEMPEMGGHELTRKIKGDPVLKGIPVLLFSSLISEVIRQEGETAGADAQISKPDLPQLAQHVKKIIDKYAAN